MYLKEHTANLFEMLPEGVRECAILGGGCMRSYYDDTPVKDIDCFFRDRDDYLACIVDFERSPRWRIHKDCERYCEFIDVKGRIVTLIGFVFGSPEEHLGRFDFRCCRFVAWYDAIYRLKIDFASGAVTDASKKLLYIQNNNGTERTLRRIRHYVEDYGYRLHPAQTVEQEDAFEEAFDAFDAHRPQGVHPSDFKEASPLYMRIARRRVAALPVQHYPYPGE